MAKKQSVEKVEELVEETLPALPEKVALVNLDTDPIHVPVRGGFLRVGPKTSKVLDAEDVTDDTRQLEQQGRIHIRNL